MRKVLGQERVLHHVVLIRRITIDICALRSDGPKLHREWVKVALLFLLGEVVEGTIAAARAVPKLPAAPDVPIGEVQPQVFSGTGLLAPPILRLGADLLRRWQLHKVLVILGLLQLLVLLPSMAVVHRLRTLVGNDRLASLGNNHREIWARQRHCLLRASCIDDEQEVFLDNVPLVLGQESSSDPYRQLCGLGRIICGLHLRHALELLHEVETALVPIALHVEVHHVCPEAEPRFEVHAEAALTEGCIKGEDALVLINLVIVLRASGAAHHLPGFLDGRIHGCEFEPKARGWQSARPRSHP
mmetsp:Transcript_78526/g.168252  ORF Transcript_78526/g.168252 Transcript_78526/m.168252 type:complete len:301 (+) Transcript_78526:1787-2689(+)